MDYESNANFPYTYSTLNPPFLTPIQIAANYAASLINVNLPYPQTQITHYVGTSSNPLTIEAFNSITYTGTISTLNGNIGNVVMHAGNDIHLANGTHIGAGQSATTFFYHAYAKPFCCSNSSQSYARSTDSTVNDGSGFDMMDNDATMSLLSTKDSTHHEWAVIPNMDEDDDLPDSLLQYLSDSTGLDSSVIRLAKMKHYSNFNNPSISYLSLFPNPFSSETKLTFLLNSADKVNIYLFNQLGQLVQTITENDNRTMGVQTFIINRQELPSGIYQLQLKTESGIINKQIVIQ